jgi:hypothetical protein
LPDEGHRFINRMVFRNIFGFAAINKINPDPFFYLNKGDDDAFHLGGMVTLAAEHQFDQFPVADEGCQFVKKYGELSVFHDASFIKISTAKNAKFFSKNAKKELINPAD